MLTDILPLIPIMLPFFMAVLMLLVGKRPVKHRAIAAIGGLILIIVSAYQVFFVYQNGMYVTYIGGWEPPFGITVVIDMVAAILVLTTSIIVFFITVFSFQSIGEPREKYYFYAIVMVMLSGINGAFLTGDIFNMFVFFEVFLLSSYILITLGGEKLQLREGFKYVLINIVSSNFFVLGLAYIYSVTGTLNMADMQMKIASYEGDTTGLTIVAIVFLLVFATKAGMFPLYSWLPNSYAAPPIPILALFGALLTKVGIYAIARTFSLFFVDNVEFTSSIILWLAVLTIIAGCIGALAYLDMKKVIIYNIIIAVGVILVGFSLMDAAGSIGAMYYLIHDMLIKAALFLLIGVIIFRTGETNSERLGGLIKVHPVLGWTFFIAGLSLAGVPPLSGFYGKLFIVESALDNQMFIAAIVVLLSSLVVLYSIMRVFMNVFWGEDMDFDRLKDVKMDKMMFSAISLVVIAVVFGLSADFLYPLFEMAAQSFYDPASYSSYLLEVQ